MSFFFRCLSQNNECMTEWPKTQYNIKKTQYNTIFNCGDGYVVQCNIAFYFLPFILFSMSIYISYSHNVLKYSTPEVKWLVNSKVRFVANTKDARKHSFD